MGVPLACCGGQAPPPAVVEGWKAYLTLATEPQSHIWDVVIAGILEPENALNRVRVEALVESQTLPAEQAASILQATGFLLTQACASDLSVEEFRQDLTRLSSGAAPGSEVLLALFPGVKERVREFLLQRTLADHGHVLLSLDWRVDQVSASNRAVRLNTPVIFLTLGYLYGDQRRRISLQVTPEGLKDLRRFLAQFD